MFFFRRRILSRLALLLTAAWSSTSWGESILTTPGGWNPDSRTLFVAASLPKNPGDYFQRDSAKLTLRLYSGKDGGESLWTSTEYALDKIEDELKFHVPTDKGLEAALDDYNGTNRWIEIQLGDDPPLERLPLDTPGLEVRGRYWHLVEAVAWTRKPDLPADPILDPNVIPTNAESPTPLAGIYGGGPSHLSPTGVRSHSAGSFGLPPAPQAPFGWAGGGGGGGGGGGANGGGTNQQGGPTSTSQTPAEEPQETDEDGPGGTDNENPGSQGPDTNPPGPNEPDPGSGNDDHSPELTPPVVPEPSSLGLAALAAIALRWLPRRRRDVIED